MKTSNRQMRGGSSGMHPERRITLDSIRCDNLPPHPLSVKIYGTPKPTEELLASIEKVGLLQPLVVNDYGNGSYELLVGNTRAEAWRALFKQNKVKSVWIPCRFVSLSSVEAEQLVIESNRQRVKTTEQRGREFSELKRIEAELAKLRESVGKKVNGKTNLSDGQARAIAAEKTGLAQVTAEKLEKIVRAADAGDRTARKDLDQINKTGRGVDPAFRRLTPEEKSKKKQQKSEIQIKVAELQKLFKKAEVQSSKEPGLFNLLFMKITEREIRKAAEAL